MYRTDFWTLWEKARVGCFERTFIFRGLLKTFGGISHLLFHRFSHFQRNMGEFKAFFSFHVAQLLKNLPGMRETWVSSLGWEDSLEKGKATHSSILAWRIPWTVSSMRSQRVDMTKQLSLPLSFVSYTPKLTGITESF